MEIVLLTHSPVVGRLVALSLRHRDDTLQEYQTPDAVAFAKTDLLLVDEAIGEEAILEASERIQARYCALFVATDTQDYRGYDETVVKPFLPSRILGIVQQVEGIIAASDEAQEQETMQPTLQEGTEVLDIQEAAHIAQLLDEIEHDEPIAVDPEEIAAAKVALIRSQLQQEGLEIINEEDLVETFTPLEDTRTDEDSALMAALASWARRLGPKKRAKLMAGKKVTCRLKRKDWQ